MLDQAQRALKSVVEDETTGEIRAQFEFPLDTPFFAGHFPQMPVVPGVVELELARAALQEATGQSYSIRRVQSAKFTEMVPPGRPIDVTVAHESVDGGVKVKAVVRLGETVAARIVMLLTPANESPTTR